MRFKDERHHDAAPERFQGHDGKRPPMKREAMMERLIDFGGYWDMVVIGGGATGLGVGIDAASRGYKTLLLESDDFARGTSSRSTKLVHGGVRYLRRGNISLVLEALRERGLLLRNAPHLVHHQSFIVPNYGWWEGPFYGAGMKVYDLMAGSLGLSPSRRLSREETMAHIPTLESEGLRGGVIYYDGQFDDARLAVDLARTMADAGGTLLNYMEVTGLMKAGGMIQGVMAADMETGREYEINARVVVNATGVYADAVRRMDTPEAPAIIAPSQGVHLVLEKRFLPGDSAIMVPHTEDGRVLFAVPWRDRVILGTTDTPVTDIPAEPRALPEEIDFILSHAARYLTEDPTRGDIKSVFAGLRPLARETGAGRTSDISRDHFLMISESGLVTIAGGKWTTYRRMAQETVDKAAMVAGLEERDCVTQTLRIHGWLKNCDRENPLHYHGSDAVYIQKLMRDDPSLAMPIHPEMAYTRAEVVWAAREEMARTVADVLSRRARALILDARASIESAPGVARILAVELGRDQAWEAAQVAAYEALARGYLAD